MSAKVCGRWNRMRFLSFSTRIPPGPRSLFTGLFERSVEVGLEPDVGLQAGDELDAVGFLPVHDRLGVEWIPEKEGTAVQIQHAGAAYNLGNMIRDHIEGVENKWAARPIKRSRPVLTHEIGAQKRFITEVRLDLKK